MSYQSKILIADDDEIVRENLEDLLSHDNHLLEFAVNGQEALEKAFNNSFDVILLDIMMPYMDGLQTCQKLREHPATAEIPIIILTALDDRASRINGIKAGADDFISKPFDHTELRTRIRSIIRLNRYRRLLAERTKFERVVENSETGYLLIGEQDQIVFVNSKASFYLGLPTDELVGQSFLTVAKMHYRPEPMEAWLTWPDDALPGVSRYLVQPESPTARDFWLQANVLDHLYAEPNPIWIVSLVDVTAQMTSLREVREFHALIAHKLHTPLNSILVSAEILSQRGHELPKQDINQLSTIAFSGAKRLHEDIEQILRYMDMTSALPLLDEGCQVGQIEKIVERICHQLYDSCHFDIPPDIQQLAVALPEATMEVILWELLDNSRKFHPQNQPALSIYVSCKSDNMLCIAVCDNGIHLSAEQLARAWTPYYQGDKYFTGQIKGMGLGLAMVASFVWSVGGNCHISNLIDQPGVSVELILPVKTTP